MSRSGAGFRRYFETVRHLRWRQVSNRIRRRLLPLAARTIHGAKLHRIEGWTLPIAKSRQLAADGELRIFGISRDASSSMLWFDDSVPRLWLYHAHYCDDLASSEVPDDDKRRLISAWIDGNPSCSSPGWDAYPTSRRIVNWLKFYLAGGQLEPKVVDSLAMQADYLARNLEFHLLGNHLLANLKALIFAGLLIDTPASGKWAEQGERLLRQQLAEQILPDGGHHELSPMYHAVVLEDLLDLANLGATVRPSLAAELRPVCTSMLDWLLVMTHPDGGIAFFNDAALNGCAPTEEIRNYADHLGIRPTLKSVDGLWNFPESGYIRMGARPMTLIADIAEVGPAHLPGHAHADSLSFELSVHGQRVIVNSGTSTYEDNTERHWQRSTRAHNTVVIDGQNSSDVWSAFRVGRRASVIDRQVVESRERYEASGSHDGYLRRAGVMHTRSWELSADLLTIRDKLTGCGNHAIESHMHLHPDVSPQELGPGRFRLELPDSGITLEVHFDKRLHTRLTGSTFHPGFGSDVPNTRLTAAANLELPCELAVTVRLVR